MAKKQKFKWDWKVFFIVLFLVLFLFMGIAYSDLEDEYKDYQQQANSKIYQMQLDSANDYSDMDCYERGTVDCYEKGSVDCFTKGSVGKAENDLEEFLRNNDCYERGTVYCYNEPRALYSCEAGYSLACVKS